jgi:hypothetical protein
VVDNGMFGTIRMHQERNYPGRVAGTDLVNPDFAALARAYGADGLTVEATDQFAPAFERAVASGRPALLHVKVDPQAITMNATLDGHTRVSVGARSGKSAHVVIGEYRSPTIVGYAVSRIVCFRSSALLRSEYSEAMPSSFIYVGTHGESLAAGYLRYRYPWWQMNRLFDFASHAIRVAPTREASWAHSQDSFARHY